MSSKAGIFNMLMALVKSNQEESGYNDEEEEEEDRIIISEFSDNEDEGLNDNDLDIMLEENILEEKIKDLTIDNNQSSDVISDLIGIPKQNESEIDEQLKIIELALYKNRTLKKMLQTLECNLLLLKRDLGRSSDSNNSSVKGIVRWHSTDFYYSFGAPYFKVAGFSCPVNSDQYNKEKNKPKLYDNYDIFSNWEEEELVTLEQSIRDVIAQDYLISWKHTPNNIKIECDSEHKLKVIDEVAFIRTANLLEVFKKYDETELDWDRISVMLDNPHTGRDCKLMWDMYLKPSIRKDKWTRKEEMALVKSAKNFDHQNWDLIAVEVGSNRTAYQCFSHFQQHLNKTSKKWTTEEMEHFQEVLRLAKSKESINWSRIKYFVDNSDFISLYNKWYKTRCVNSEAARKGKFNEKEDKFIIGAIKKGIPLHKIHNYLPTRNSCQIRERFVNYLDVKNRKYGIWTTEEDTLLLSLIKQYGEGQWASIAKHFENRSRTQIRQHYENLKKMIMKNPNVDLEKIKRRKNIYDYKSIKPGKDVRSRKEIKLSKKDLKTIPYGLDFLKDKENLALYKHFAYKKLEFKQKSSVNYNILSSNSEAILGLSEILGINLSVNQIDSFQVSEHRRQLTDFALASIEFIKKSNESSLINGENKIGDKIKLLPPNIASVNGYRNILARLSLEKQEKSEQLLPYNLTGGKGINYKKAVDNWSKRMFILFASAHILKDINVKEFKNTIKNQEMLTNSDNPEQ